MIIFCGANRRFLKGPPNVNVDAGDWRGLRVTNYGYALIVVDMQNGFCHPEGSFSRLGLELEGAQDAVRNAALAVKQARAAGVPVIFTRHIYRQGRADQGPSLIRNSPAIAFGNGLAAGAW